MGMPERNVAVGVGIGVGVGAVLAGWWAWRRLSTPSLPQTWEEVGEVSELVIYPVKSARGIQKKEAEATIYGLLSEHLEDRAFVVVDEGGTLITGRTVGILTAVLTKWNGQTLTLKAPDIEDVSVVLDRDLSQEAVPIVVKGLNLQGVDCGDKVAEWLSKVMYNGEKKVRLMYHGDAVRDRPSKKPDYHEFKNYLKTDRVFYADNSAYMLGCQSSLDDLNNRLEEPVLMENFRPNIVVNGSKAYDEDDWVYVKIGQVILRRLKPCDRCVLITVDPLTGNRHKNNEPMTTLRKYRLVKEPPTLAKAWATKPVFGITMGIETTGPIFVGDKVSIARASVHPHLKGF